MDEGRRASRGGVEIKGLAIAAALSLGGFGTGAAQWDEGPSVLSLLPLEGSISMGESVSGSLDASDYLSGGQRVVAYEFVGAEGEPLIVDLVSDDFDAYLTLLGPDGHEFESDDDSGGACHARISTFLEDGGTYRIIASSLSGETGAFTLSVGNRRTPAAPGECGGGAGYYGGDEVMDVLSSLVPEGTLSLGGQTEAAGTLDADDAEMSDGSYVEAWLVSGQPGDVVWVDLMSRSFDTLLFVVEPGGEDYYSDDDSGGACNSRMEIVLENEPHTIVVNSLSAGGSGPFTLRVSATEGPQASGSCPGLFGDMIR